ncbi:hypothetical protein Hanom_Chr15g01407291 [Helianthus anomalus]
MYVCLYTPLKTGMKSIYEQINLKFCKDIKTCEDIGSTRNELAYTLVDLPQLCRFTSTVSIYLDCVDLPRLYRFSSTVLITLDCVDYPRLRRLPSTGTPKHCLVLVVTMSGVQSYPLDLTLVPN